MNPSYDVLIRFFRWFLGRDHETQKLFWAESRKGYYRLLWVQR